MLTVDHIREQLQGKGLKVTPQRIIVMQAVDHLDHHPTADHIFEYIRRSNPNIAKGTVYNVLEVLSEHQLIKKVKTEKDIMRYDGILKKHHHLYCSESDRIEDYMDEELDKLLESYFNQKQLKDFRIEDIILQIKGRFLKQKQD